MARIRMVKPEFFRDAKLMRVPITARLAFIGLWALADREGRLVDDPEQIKVELFPGDRVDMGALLTALVEVGVLRRYVVDELALLEVVHFGRHQHVHPSEAASRLPPAPPQVRESPQYPEISRGAVRSHGKPGSSTSTSTSTSDPPLSPSETSPPPGEPTARALLPMAQNGDEPFGAFWAAYPRRVGKAAAKRAWATHQPSIVAVLETLAWQTRHPRWLEEGGRFVPNPATWLNQHRWLDEETAVTAYVNPKTAAQLASVREWAKRQRGDKA